MNKYSTRQAAQKLELDLTTVQRYIAAGKIPAPALVEVGGGKLRIWTDEDIEHVRKLLPKIANGRKTRYQKLREKQGTQPRVAALHKKRKPTKKKK
jgi:excisionase family DNA binding protein